MIGNAFLTFYRITTRHPLYAALDLLGLSFGVAVFITLSLYIRFETGFESWLPHADEIYLVKTRYTMPGKPERAMEFTPAPLLDTLLTDYPDLAGARTLESDADVRKGDVIMREHEVLADADFFMLFDLPLLSGDKATALSEPGNIVISQAMARKYLAHGEGLGTTIQLSDEEGSNLYTVSGIIAGLPNDTDLRFDFIRRITPGMMAAKAQGNQWGRMSVRTYLRFADPRQVERQEAAFDAFSDNQFGNQANGQPMHNFLTWRLVPLRSAHLEDQHRRDPLVILGLVALLSLAVAAINHVNLATARAGMRAREVAVRRSLGATRGTLVRQFLVEAVQISLLAWIGGLSLVELAIPLVNSATGLSLSLDYAADGTFFLAMAGAILLLGLLAGVYPAYVLAQFQPAQVLASSRSPSGGRIGSWVREALVVLQFAVVAVFFAVTWGFFSQIEHLQRVDLGFRRDGLLLIQSTSDNAMTPAMLRQVWAALRRVPDVTAVGSGDGAPGKDNFNSYVVVTVTDLGREAVSLSQSAVEADFFSAYGATLLAGRLLDPMLPGDGELSEDAARHVVLNARAMSILGFATPEEAIGRVLLSYGKKLEIVGVIGDLRFRSPKTQLEGYYYYVAAEAQLHTRQVAAIRYQGVSETEMRDRLASAWHSVAPGIPLELSSAEDSLDKYYRPERTLSYLFSLGAAGAALIGCLGLYGMTAFGTSRRLLEVAIRKVAGATRRDVMTLLIGQFLRPVVLANLIAAPIAYLALGNWLVQFEDHIAIGALPFIVAAGAAFLIALGTVSAMAFTAANAPPDRALRHE